MKTSIFTRTALLASFVCFLFCLLIVQFFQLQIIEGEKWSKQARMQHQFTVTEPGARGVFYSNTDIVPHMHKKGRPFVVDIPKFHLFVDPLSIPKEHKEIVAQSIARLLQLDSEKIASHFYKKARSRRLAQFLDAEKKAVVMDFWRVYAKEHKLVRNGLYVTKEYQRSYPFGHSLGQVLHTVREGENEKRHIATGGLEQFFDSILVGKDGKRRLLRSPRNPLDTGQTLLQSEKGCDIYLTINHTLQAICEEEVEKAAKMSGAETAWAVLMDPHTGDVFAIAQYPFYHPQEYKEFFQTSEKAAMTKVRAVSDCFEPGSTMKPLTLALALKANEENQFFDPKEMIRCDNGHFPGRTKPVKDVRTHRFLNLDMAMQKSSNVYCAKMVHEILKQHGAGWYRKELEETFGFGKKTRIELPSETAGMLPTPGKHYKNGRPEWSQPTPYSLAFGYNLLANTFQMLRAYAVIANGGYLIEPTLVKRIEKDGDLLPTRERAKKQVLASKISVRIIEAMRYNMMIGGSGRRGEVPGYTECGKTGTTEILVGGKYDGKKHFSSFIGFAPANNPKLLCYVGVYRPDYIGKDGSKVFFGGRCAAPPFAKIMERSLTYLGVPQDDPYGFPPGDKRRNAAKASWYKETQKLLKLYRKYN